MIWDQMTSPQLAGVDRKTPVILPISATEQHGPHLPVATDRLIGEHFCHQLHRNIPDDVLILPSLGIGCSSHHMDFVGTLSLSHSTFLSVCEDVLQSVAHHGFQNLVIFNSHGGNQGIGTVLFEKFGHAHPKCHLVLATWWKLASEELKQLNESGPGGAGHAGELETSLLLFFAKQWVQQAVIENGHHAPTYLWDQSDMLYASKASLYRSLKEMSNNGVFGRPSFATAEKGGRISMLIVNELRKIILDLKGNHV